MDLSDRPETNRLLVLESTRDVPSSDVAAWLMVHRALRKLEQDGGEAGGAARWNQSLRSQIGMNDRSKIGTAIEKEV